MYKNYYNKTLKKCSMNPLTGYNRDGYCRPTQDDQGKHLVCAKLNKTFLDFTAKKGNNLRPFVKEKDKWCLCVHRYLEALREKKAPIIVKNATHKKAKQYIQREKKDFLYNPNDPKRSFDVYIDKDPSDTISIQYKTIEDVKNTIKKLERLYKSGKYSHKRIWQVAMILKVRLEAMKKNRKTYKKAKHIVSRFRLANRYYRFLRKRTTLSTNTKRKRLTFTY